MTADQLVFQVSVLHELQGRGSWPEVRSLSHQGLDLCVPAARFCEYLLERPDWRVYPNQKWFEEGPFGAFWIFLLESRVVVMQDEKGNEYHCPLGKKLVDFADESHFSRIAMPPP